VREARPQGRPQRKQLRDRTVGRRIGQSVIGASAGPWPLHFDAVRDFWMPSITRFGLLHAGRPAPRNLSLAESSYGGMLLTKATRPHRNSVPCVSGSGNLSPSVSNIQEPTQRGASRRDVCASPVFPGINRNLMSSAIAIYSLRAPPSASLEVSNAFGGFHAI